MKTTKRRPHDPQRMLRLFQAVRLIERFLRGKMMADLVFDKLLQSGMERPFETQGEAATHISAETQALWAGINWQGAKIFRNLIAHEYFRVDLATL